MAFPRVIPHGDGAGVIDAVGPDVARDRLGERVWTYLAQSYRPFGTAAEYVVVPATRAVRLPAEVQFEQASGLGIPGITAHRAVFADGPVCGSTLVVTGALGAVGRAAVAVARRGGASVIATVRVSDQIDQALSIGADHADPTCRSGSWGSRTSRSTSSATTTSPRPPTTKPPPRSRKRSQPETCATRSPPASPSIRSRTPTKPPNGSAHAAESSCAPAQ